MKAVSRLRLWLAGMLLGIMVGGVASATQCPTYWSIAEPPANTYYALIFEPGISNVDAERLRDELSPKLNDIARELNRKLGPKRRVALDLLACDYSLVSDDLGHREMLDYQKVVAVFWRSNVSGRVGVVQLALPLYLTKEDLTRQQAEVVMPSVSNAANPVDQWIEIMAQDARLYRPFVAMGLASVYRRDKDWRPTLGALCIGRAGLVTLAPNALRPEKQRLLEDIVQPLRDVEDAARRSGPGGLPACDPASPD